MNIAQLKDICIIAPSKSEAKSHKLGGGDMVSFLPMEDLGIGTKHITPNKSRRYDEVSGSYTYFKEGDVLLAKVTPCFENGKLGIATGLVNGVGYGSSELIVIRPDTDKVVPAYLYYRLQEDGFRRDGRSLMVGACGLKRLPKSYVADTSIYLPSTSEQQRIVDILDEEFEKIDRLRSNAELNLQHAKALFQAALNKELEPKDGWKTLTIGEVCDVQGGSTPLRSEPLYWDGGTYPWFTVDDIREQGRVITDTKQKITKLAWDKLRVFPADTILLCCTASVGEYAITAIPLTSNQQFNGLTIKKGIKIAPMYLFHYASTLKEKLLGLSGKATIDFVSGAKVKSIPISYPSLVEQQKIIAKLDELDAKCKVLQDNYTKTIALCDDLKQALLRKAFNGEL